MPNFFTKVKRFFKITSKIRRFFLCVELRKIQYKLATMENEDLEYLADRIKKKYALPYCENPEDGRLVYDSLFRSVGVVKILAKIL